MAAREAETAAPRAAAGLADAARAARQEGKRLVPRGAGLRLDPDLAATARLVDVREYNRIVRWTPEDLVVQVEAGATVAEVNRALAERAQWIPTGLPDGGDDTVGGLLAAGLDGFWRTGFGPLRERVLALTVWTPAFGVVRVGAPVVKNVAGYNLPRLYWGSSGAFGVILDATFKVAPRPAAVAVWTQDLSDPAEADWAASRLEALARPWSALLVTGEAGTVRLWAVWTGSRASVDRLSSRLGPPQETTWEAVEPRLGPPPPGLERFLGAVPRGRARDLFRAVIQRSGFAAVDWGTGAFWVRLKDANRHGFREEVRSLGGGVRPWRASGVTVDDPAVLRLLDRLKHAVDPDGILMPLGGGEQEEAQYG